MATPKAKVASTSTIMPSKQRVTSTAVRKVTRASRPAACKPADATYASSSDDEDVPEWFQPALDRMDRFAAQTREMMAQTRAKNREMMVQMAAKNREMMNQMAAKNREMMNQMAAQNREMMNQMTAQNREMNNQMTAQNRMVMGAFMQIIIHSKPELKDKLAPVLARCPAPAPVPAPQ